MPLFRCVKCSRQAESDRLDASCEACGSALILVPKEVRPKREQFDELPAGVWRYRVFLPGPAASEPVTLGEGATPLLRASRLGRALGLDNLLIKDESRNPTGSFIDRGSTVLVSLAKSRGVTACSCVTTGNLGASLAAYCARAGMTARIRIHPSTDRGKLYQMLAFGARIEAPAGGGGVESEGGRSLSVTAGNPYILEGEKTTFFEIAQDLGWKAPGVVAVPVGTGGHLSTIWRAFLQLRDCGLIEGDRCRLLGVQFEGSAPMLGQSRRTRKTALSEAPFTELEESEPFFREEVVRAIRESRGIGLTTTAAESVRATGLLARTEGIFAEPASASVVASIEAAVRRGLVRRDEVVVCVITGAGLKDTKAISMLAKATRRVPVREEYTLARIQVGETKLAILRMLAGGPGYGYDLWQRLSVDRKITTTSVYQHLSELEALALVVRAGAFTEGGRERVLYSLTKKGGDFLKIAGKIERTERTEGLGSP